MSFLELAKFRSVILHELILKRSLPILYKSQQFYLLSIIILLFPLYHAVQDNNIGIGSVILVNSISPSTTIGTKVATVNIIQLSSSIQVPFMRLLSYASTTYNLYPVVFGIAPNAADPSRITPVPSGTWNSYQWMDITKYKSATLCRAVNGKQYSRYVVDIYVTSTIYPEGDWTISLNFLPPSDTCAAQITVKGTSCIPSERFDVDRKVCVAICGCGLVTTEQFPICVLGGKWTSCVHWVVFTVV